MDTFFEQIVSIRKNGKTLAAMFGIWFAALILAYVIFAFLLAFIGGIAMLVIFGLFFGAWKLSGLLNIEYEYIITNGSMDIDKIINKSSRKRMASFELGNVTRLEKFNPHMLNTLDKKTLVYACNENDENAYLLIAEREGKSSVNVIFSPDERIKSAIEKFAPKFIVNSAFK